MAAKNKFWGILLVSIMVFSIVGCGNMLDKMNQLSINMHKEEVRAIFKTGFVAKASKVDAEGNLLDLWEFYDKKSKSTYQIYFLNDQVSQWGKREELQAFPELYIQNKKKSVDDEDEDDMDDDEDMEDDE
ncbi:MAG: hypothetical protein GY853_11695 [PVC group bacterium]|nr:hypothetical protein [PVC group bacterium]